MPATASDRWRLDRTAVSGTSPDRGKTGSSRVNQETACKTIVQPSSDDASRALLAAHRPIGPSTVQDDRSGLAVEPLRRSRRHPLSWRDEDGGPGAVDAHDSHPRLLLRQSRPGHVDDTRT